MYPPPEAYGGFGSPYQDDPIDSASGLGARANDSARAKAKRAAVGKGALEADLISPSLVVLPFDELDNAAEDDRELSRRLLRQPSSFFPCSSS